MEGEMKKRVFKRKKDSGQYKPGKRIRREVKKALALAAALCLTAGLITGISLKAYGQETAAQADPPGNKVVVTDIFHRHVGSADVQGGCYSVPIPHVHTGDQTNAGGCYVVPGKLHEHEGSQESGGGCYGLEIPHETHGEGCYVEETHNHGGECYGGDCTITYSNLRLRETFTDNCPGHGSTTFERSDVTESHSTCGLGVFESVIDYCQICRYMPSRTHPFINCGKQEGTTQVLVCNKTVERYETTCGFGQGQPESWLPGCGRDADGYDLGCGLGEDVPCGRLILTSQPENEGKKVIVTARVEDLSAGRLILGDEPYLWQDQTGAVLGKGERLEVEENGSYSVTVSLKNKDVDESGLRSSILIEGIPGAEPSATPTITPSPSATPSPSVTPSPGKTPAATPAPENSPEPDRTPEGPAEPSATPFAGPEEGDGEEAGDGDDTPQEAVPQPERPQSEEKGPAQEGEDGPREETDTDGWNRSTGAAAGRRDRGGRVEETQISPTPSASPLLRQKKETQAVEAKENLAQGESHYKTGQEKERHGFFRSAAVRVITVTVSAVLFAGGIVGLLVYLMCSVRIYNDNGEGTMLYLGRCLVRKKEEEYSIVITDAMTEKSCTNRYCIRPGLFRLGKGQEQELIVYREARKASASLSREMIVII